LYFSEFDAEKWKNQPYYLLKNMELPAKSREGATIAKNSKYFPRQNHIKAAKYANSCLARESGQALRERVRPFHLFP